MNKIHMSTLAKILSAAIFFLLILLLTVVLILLSTYGSPVFASDLSLVFDTETTMSNPDDIALANAEFFALGQVGFVPQTSPGESAYRKILKEPNAKARFYAIFKSNESTNAAKLYAACGLKKLASRQFREVRQDLKKSQDQVSTMRADVMRMQPISEIFKTIDRYGC